MPGRIDRRSLFMASRLMDETVALRVDIGLDPGGLKDATLRLAASLARSGLSGRTTIPVEPDLASLWKASRALAEELNFSAGLGLEVGALMPEAARCCLRPSVARTLTHIRQAADLARELAARPGLESDLLSQEQKAETSNDYDELVAIETTRGKDKISALKDLLEKLALEDLVRSAEDRSGGFRDECVAVIRVYSGPATSPTEDGLYPDPTIVLGLASALLEAGMGRVIIGSDGGEARYFGNGLAPAVILTRLGFVDEGLVPIQDIDPESPPPAKVMAGGEECDIPIIDLLSDGGKQTWSRADMRIVVASPRVHGADGLSLTLHGLVDWGSAKGNPGLARKSALSSASAHKVHLALLEAVTGSDGLGGEYSCPKSALSGTLVAGTDPLSVDIVSAWMFGLNPFSCPMIADGIDVLGLRQYRLMGRAAKVERWRNKRIARHFTTSNGVTRRLLFGIPEGSNSSLVDDEYGNNYSSALRMLLLRPLWAGTARPASISVNKLEKKLLEKEIGKRESRAKLSVSDQAFFELASELPRRDIAALLAFLKSESESIEAGTNEPKRLGHVLRMGDAFMEFRSFTARPVLAATEILRGVVYGRWDLQTVIEDLRVWEEIHSLPLGLKLSINRFNAPRRRILARE